ncbi:arginase family protein [Streptomyces luteolus]|uniref:Arginase family protein n=1 Tax=Streptomyces luteolus TaxID=3043615 RepID=A0ABT6SPX7_9ACTN|nr:arginase family protein [Streptomyces sp. B-S-A12]MDI3417615.1 arginase family protein [Streptomyces sp. B-S-A12]
MRHLDVLTCSLAATREALRRSVGGDQGGIAPQRWRRPGRHCAAALAATREALRRSGDEPLLVVGGDCGVELAPVSHTVARHGDNLAVVWFDAHADPEAFRGKTALDERHGARPGVLDSTVGRTPLHRDQRIRRQRGLAPAGPNEVELLQLLYDVRDFADVSPGR